MMEPRRNPTRNGLDSAEALLADTVPVTPVEIAWVFPASDIYPNATALTQFPSDSEFLQRYNDGHTYYLTIFMSEEPPIVR